MAATRISSEAPVLDKWTQAVVAVGPSDVCYPKDRRWSMAVLLLDQVTRGPEPYIMVVTRSLPIPSPPAWIQQRELYLMTSPAGPTGVLVQPWLTLNLIS